MDVTPGLFSDFVALRVWDFIHALKTYQRGVIYGDPALESVQDWFRSGDCIALGAAAQSGSK